MTRPDPRTGGPGHPAAPYARTSTDVYPSRDVDLAFDLSLTSGSRVMASATSRQCNLQPALLFEIGPV